MKNKLFALIRFLLMTLLISGGAGRLSVHAAFDDLGVGARAPGMADAFTGVADDANALYYNPAGLAQLVKPELTGEYSRLNVGLDDGSELGTTYLGFAWPLAHNKGTVAFGYHNFKLTSFYDERQLLMSYGFRPKLQPFGDQATLLAGITVKELHREFISNAYTENALNNAGLATDQADPVFAANGNSTDDVAFDIGSLVRFGPQNRWSAGLTVMNVNRPDVSLAGDGDKPPLISKLGLSYRPDWGVLTAEARRAKRLQGKSDTEFAFGAERRLRLGDWGAVEFRGGYAEGSREFKETNVGFSYLFDQFQIDYSFAIPVGNLTDFNGSHRMAFSVRFGGKTKKSEEKEGKDRAAPTPENVHPALIAPQPVVKSTVTDHGMTEFDAKIKNFTEALGYYFKRKDAGASLDELEGLLNQMVALLKGSGVDMSVVEKELNKIKEAREAAEKAKAKPAQTPKPTVAPKPVSKPAPKPHPKPKPKRKKLSKIVTLILRPEFNETWTYYKRAVGRGLTDAERLEVLEAMRDKFKGPEQEQILKELRMIQRRIQ